MVRAIKIDLFDVNGKPMPEVSLWFPARLSVALTETDVQAMGGVGRVLNEHASRRLGIQSFIPSPAGGSWTDIYATFDVTTRVFSAPVRHFSEFALVWSSAQPTPVAPTPPPQPTPAPTSTAILPPPGDFAASSTILAALAALGAFLFVSGVFLWRTARRS